MKANRPTTRRAVLVGGVAVFLTVCLLATMGSAPTLPAFDEDTPPPPAGPTLNSITILVDDMNDFSCRDTHRYLPKSSRWLRDRGRCFENASGTTPVCCPARAEMFTGQLPHNNGVERQVDARVFRAADSVQRELGDAGVSTYATGKIFNGVKAKEYVTGEFDPGFERFDAWNNYDYYNYQLIDENGEGYVPDERIHTTVRSGRNLRDFVSEMAESSTPFFAYAGFFAPHTNHGKPPEVTAPNRNRAVPRFRFRTERNTRDKLKPFWKLDMSRGQLERLHKARVRSLYDVDDEIAATFNLLQSTGLLDNTAVIFASDNGYSMGQNGWEAKAAPYRGSRNVPMLAYLPKAFGSGVVDTRPVGLVDIAPTLYDLYDVTPGHTLDGHSLAGSHRRKVEYHEFRNEKNRFVLQESGFAPFRMPTWRMVSTPDGRSYIAYYNSRGRRIHEEFYKDAAQKRNLLYPGYKGKRPSKTMIKRFRSRLVQLRRCRGTTEQRSLNPCP
jgi:arylsulfatase A-like enzyme